MWQVLAVTGVDVAGVAVANVAVVISFLVADIKLVCFDANQRYQRYQV